jgi:hypothetical protein
VFRPQGCRPVAVAGAGGAGNQTKPFRYRPPWYLCLAVALLQPVLIALASSPPAGAAFPGANGKIELRPTLSGRRPITN